MTVKYKASHSELVMVRHIHELINIRPPTFTYGIQQISLNDWIN